MSRKYQDLWEYIKENYYATIYANPTDHKTIIQAVRKERSRDIVWRDNCLRKRVGYKLTTHILDRHIQFSLTKSLDL